MRKKSILFGSALLVICFLLAMTPDTALSGALYIVNDTDWDMKVTAHIKDSWDVVTPSNWSIVAHGAEKIATILKLHDIQFQPDIDDDATTPAWLKITHALHLELYRPAKDLIVTISKNRYVDKWDVKQLHVTTATVAYTGAVGHVKIVSY